MKSELIQQLKSIIETSATIFFLKIIPFYIITRICSLSA